MPRSAIMITRSLKLSLKLAYQLTHRMMTCPSKCRPLNSASTGPKGCTPPSSAIGRVCTKAVLLRFFLPHPSRPQRDPGQSSRSYRCCYKLILVALSTESTSDVKDFAYYSFENRFTLTRR